MTFDDKMQKIYENKLNITYRMKDAINNREFSVFYQPKIDFRCMCICGAEALVRWFPKEGKPIFPDEFIPVFEQNGFILTLDLYVLDEVCRYFLQNEKILNIPKISVNLSAYSILAEDVIERITEIVEIHDIDPKKLEFELTESAVESDIGLFLQRVKELKSLGFTVSIDDFGAGLSSLNRLCAVEADVLKLDKEFFSLKFAGDKSKAVVASVVDMAKRIDMLVVAEGVETAEQALWLQKLNCDYAQGYYFASPMDKVAFSALLQSQKIFSIEEVISKE